MLYRKLVLDSHNKGPLCVYKLISGNCGISWNSRINMSIFLKEISVSSIIPFEQW